MERYEIITHFQPIVDLTADGVDGTPLTMNVNLSGSTVMQPRVIGDIAMVLEETGVDPHHVVLELTEGLLLDSAEGAIHQLHAVKDLWSGWPSTTSASATPRRPTCSKSPWTC